MQRLGNVTIAAVFGLGVCNPTDRGSECQISAGAKLKSTDQDEPKLELIEGKVLGGGAFSRVSKVMAPSNRREYAMKRMRKTTVLQCPEHVFCEQHITRNTAHPFCIRQVCLRAENAL